MRIYNIHETKTPLSKLIEQVLAGEEVVIGKAGRPVAKLVAYEPVINKRTPGRLAGQIHITDDFDKLPDNLKGFF
ncbi:MAG: prevent-host-death protein [Coxiella sp. (in: Bacteria)]|nr:MAG: prevent-host-death protein [Coxiella sp. (in: g-proteobacteria)]